MPRKKPRIHGQASKDDEPKSEWAEEDDDTVRQRWWEEICEEICDRYDAFVAIDAMNALNHGEREREFGRAMSARYSSADRDELERRILIWLQPYIDAAIGRKAREAGSTSPGRRGQNDVAPNKLLAEVQAMHDRSPLLTFNDVCGKVAKANGYKSAYPAKRAAAAIKWPDPRRNQK